MAHATLPAHTFFEQQRRRLEHLVVMPVPSLNGGNEAISWYFRAIAPSEEQELLAGGEALDSDYDDNESSSATSDSSSAEFEAFDNDAVRMELDDIRKEDPEYRIPDDPGKGIHDHELRPRTDEPVFGPPGTTTRPEVGVSTAIPRLASLSSGNLTTSLNQQVYEIYTQNGWGTQYWDRQQCTDGLLQWVQYSKEGRKQYVVSKAEARLKKRVANRERSKEKAVEGAAS